MKDNSGALSKEFIVKLMEKQGFPSISIYLPVHRQRPEHDQNRIRFKNAVKKIELQLGDSALLRPDYEPLLERLRSLERETVFWGHQLDGLAIFCAANHFSIHKLLHKVPETVVIADSFHVKPVIRETQSADRFQVLLLSQDIVQLYEGNRYHLEKLYSPDLPKSLVDALGPEVEEDHLTVASYGHKGGRGGFAPGKSPAAMYHGHSKKKDKEQVDLERFYRRVDEVVCDNHSNPTKLPLLLVALPEAQGMFRSISHNKMLIKRGLDIHPSSMDENELQKRVGQFMRESYMQLAAREIERFHKMKSKKLASDDLKEIGLAIRSGKVETLLVEGEKFLPGIIEKDGVPTILAQEQTGSVDDLLDDLSEETLRQGGDVIVFHEIADSRSLRYSEWSAFPFENGVGAIYRY
jgi:hypothetical protein